MLSTPFLIYKFRIAFFFLLSNQMSSIKVTTVTSLCLHLRKHVLGALTTLWSLPVDVLIGHFDITRLAVNAAIHS